MTLRRAGILLAVLLGLAACSGHSSNRATTTSTSSSPVTSATFRAQVVALYAPFDKKPVPDDFATGAAKYDGFATAVGQLDAPTSETVDKGAIVSAAHAAAATLRKYPSILEVPQSSALNPLYALQRLVHDLPP